MGFRMLAMLLFVALLLPPLPVQACGMQSDPGLSAQYVDSRPDLSPKHDCCQPPPSGSTLNEGCSLSLGCAPCAISVVLAAAAVPAGFAGNHTEPAAAKPYNLSPSHSKPLFRPPIL